MPLVTSEEALAGGLKLAAAFPVLRWPLAGVGIVIVADLLDIVIMNYVDLGGGGIRDYHVFDKLTDLPALATFFIVALHWQGRDRLVAIVLFAARILGIALFELAGWRGALIFLPNLFESWFLYVLIRNAWLPRDSPRAQGLVLAGLVAFKLAQEYILHGAQILDRYNLSELIDKLRK